MIMSSCIQYLSSLSFLLLTLALLPFQVSPKTHDGDIAVLTHLRQAIDPNTIHPSSFILTWDFSHDPCENMEGYFLGILCDDGQPSRVTEINLDDPGYDGFLAPIIGNLTELRKLNLTNNNFRGPVPNTIMHLSKLTTLDLSRNYFRGNPWSHIVRLKFLEVLDVSSNALRGSIPQEISGLRHLTHLGLSRNQFYGDIPELTGLWQLTNLDLSFNQFHGSIPNLPTQLQLLSLRQNFLSGELPTRLQFLPHLEVLDVSKNHFTGNVGPWLLDLPSIKRVNLSHNEFTRLDVLNYTTRSMTLVGLDASHNDIWGSLPATLSTIDSLVDIDLQSNHLMGEIPRHFVARFVNSWKKLFLNDNYLVGEVPSGILDAWPMRVNSSFARNCLKCPSRFSLCRGGQRSDRECHRSP